MKFKTFEVKASEDGAGFTGYAAVFDNIDAYGDVMRKGAFAETLKEHGEDGAGVPVYWAHRMDDPMMNVGITARAVEDDRGLLVDVRLGETTEVEKQVRRLLLEGRVKQMSFAFDYLDAGPTKVDGVEAYEVREVRLHEVSVVPVGANQETEILSAKAGDLARPARKDDAAAAGEVLAEVEDAEQEETAEVTVDALRALVAGLEAAQASVSAALEQVSEVLGAASSEDADDEADAEASDEGADPSPDDVPKSVTPAMRAAQAVAIANLDDLPQRGQEGALA